MSEIYLQNSTSLGKLGFTYNACGQFTKKREYLKKQEIQCSFIKTNQINLVFKCMAYGEFKNLTKRTASDKILCDKTFNVAKNRKYD